MFKRNLLLISTLLLLTTGCGSSATAPKQDRSTTGIKSKFFIDSACDVIIDKEFLEICYDNQLKAARGVSYTLAGDLVNEENIKDRPYFYAEESIDEAYRAYYSDYTNSGYDRGHLAPDADFDYNNEDLRLIYTFANIIPQDPNVNRYFWIKAEYQERLVASTLGELMVINGVEFADTPDRIGSHNIAVPKGFWKILWNDDKNFRQCYYYDNFVLGDADLDSLDKHRVECNKLIVDAQN